MQVAISTVELISSLCRGVWDDARIKAYALTLAGQTEVPLPRLAQTARWLLTQVEPDDISPARLIAEAKRYVPPSFAALPAAEIADDVRRGYGQPTSIKVHCYGSRYAPPDAADRRRLNAHYARTSLATAAVLAKRRSEANQRRVGKGDPQHAGDVVAPLLASLMRRWLKQRPRHCDWCSSRLTEQNLRPYLEWARDLGEHRPVGTPMPADKVFCAVCAAGAICELIDGVRYDAEVRA